MVHFTVSKMKGLKSPHFAQIPALFTIDSNLGGMYNSITFITFPYFFCPVTPSPGSLGHLLCAMPRISFSRTWHQEPHRNLSDMTVIYSALHTTYTYIMCIYILYIDILYICICKERESEICKYSNVNINIGYLNLWYVDVFDTLILILVLILLLKMVVALTMMVMLPSCIESLLCASRALLFSVISLCVHEEGVTIQPHHLRCGKHVRRIFSSMFWCHKCQMYGQMYGHWCRKCPNLSGHPVVLALCQGFQKSIHLHRGSAWEWQF